MQRAICAVDAKDALIHITVVYGILAHQSGCFSESLSVWHDMQHFYWNNCCSLNKYIMPRKWQHFSVVLRFVSAYSSFLSFSYSFIESHAMCCQGNFSTVFFFVSTDCLIANWRKLQIGTFFETMKNGSHDGWANCYNNTWVTTS